MTNYTPEDMHYIYDDVKTRVRQRFRNRASYFESLAIWLVICVAGGLAFGAYDQTVFRIIGLLWTARMLVRTADFVLDELREKALDRELRQFGLPSRTELESEKAKRADMVGTRLVRLSDDGELIDFTDESDPSAQADEADDRQAADR